MSRLRLGLLGLLLAIPARADENAGSSHVAPVLPAVKLEANTAGKAKFKVGVDYTRGIDQNRDGTLSVMYQTTTSDGVTDLFSFDENGLQTPADWQIGVGGTLTWLTEFRGLTPEKRDVTRRALLDCLQRCTQAPAAKDNETFCTSALTAVNGARAEKANAARATAATGTTTPAPAPAPAAQAAGSGAAATSTTTPAAGTPAPAASPTVVAVPKELEPLKMEDLTPVGFKLTDTDLEVIQNAFPDPTTGYCAAGRESFKVIEEATRDKSSVLPRRLVSAGVALGRTSFEFLQADATDPMMLREASSKKGSITAVANAIHNDGGMVVEVGGRLQAKYAAGGKKLHYCLPAGTVIGTSTMGAAELCSDRTLGEPKQQNTAEVWAYIGSVNRAASSRFSLGAFYSRNPVDGPDDKRSYGVRAPMLLSTDILPGAGVYKGMLRITPSVLFVETDKDDAFDARFVVVLEVLTSRSLFGTAFDAL